MRMVILTGEFGKVIFSPEIPYSKLGIVDTTAAAIVKKTLQLIDVVEELSEWFLYRPSLTGGCVDFCLLRCCNCAFCS